ncbi:MAG: radical SAM protein [Thermodesulfobacteriota bacterium]
MRVLLVVYDNDSYIHWFPQGLGYIAAVMRDMGLDVEIYSQDMHHYPESHLAEYLNRNRFDAVCVSVIAGYYQYRKLLAISEAVNSVRNRPLYILGGHGPAPEPEFFFRKTQADVIVIGEGEDTTRELFAALADKRSLSGVKGIAWRDGDAVTVNPRRDLIRDIDAIPLPAYDMFPMEYYRLLRMPHCSSSDFVFPMLSGRGCTFRCNFCYRMDTGFRPRNAEAIVEEIRLLQEKWGITYIAFSDELLMNSVQRTEEICNAFLKAGLDIKWDCNGRLNYAKADVLRLMRKAGCVFINYGIEAFDDQILKNMNKALTTGQIIRGIEATLAEGISPGFNIIFGNIGENRRTLQQGVDFLLRYDDGAQMRTIRPVTPYPGSDLYYHALETGLLKDVEDFYENKHMNSDLLAVNYTDMTDDEFHAALCEANKTLLVNYFDKRKASILKQTDQLYLGRNAAFRGYRHS